MEAPSKNQGAFEPAIAGFFCQKCGDDCLSQADHSSSSFPTNLKSVQFICAEKVGLDLIKQTYEMGADGILICGCLVGKCQSLDGNAAVLAHIHKTKAVLKEMNIEPGRLRQEWICAPGGDCVRDIVGEFADHIRALGPLAVQTKGPL